MPLSSPEVFISHAHRDQTVAGLVCQALEQQHIRCWIAPRDIGVGEIWDDALVRGISESRIVILIFTSGTNESKHVKREIHMAFEKGKIVIPFRVEDVKPEGGLEYMMVGVQWLDAVVPPLERHLKDLTDRVTAILAAGITPPLQSEAAPEKLPEPKPVEPVPEPSLRPWLHTSWTWRIPSAMRSPGAMAALAVMFFVVGGGTLLHYLRPAPGAKPPTGTYSSSASEASSNSPGSSVAAAEAPSGVDQGAESPPAARPRVLPKNPMVYSPDSKTLVTGGPHDTLKLVDVKTGEVHTLNVHKGEVEKVVFSEDSNLIAADIGHGTTKLFDRTTGRELPPLRGQKGELESIAASPDGRTIATSTVDHSTSLWDRTTGKALSTMPGDQKGEVDTVAYSQDGHSRSPKRR